MFLWFSIYFISPFIISFLSESIETGIERNQLADVVNLQIRNKNMSLILLLCVIVFAGFQAESLPYDYTASIECLKYPHKPQYNGGVIQNPELNNGLRGWTAFGDATIEHRESLGNKYVVAHSRIQPYDSVSQKIYLQKGRHYTLSAWIQVNEGKVPVKALVKTSKGFNFAGDTYAESNCWSMLKGGLTADTSGEAELYFESKNTSVEIWIDSISLQPFTDEEWRSHHDQSIEKVRKWKVSIQATDEQGNPIPNATISIKMDRLGFPFGSAMNNYILNNAAYQNWFTSRFSVTTFANEMKWYSTERSPGVEDYSTADAMLQFAKQHNIAVRGHNVFWDDPNYQPSWVPSLPPDQLNSAVERRVNSIVSRYRGQLIGWDVVNENLHFSFFESKLGQSFSGRMFNEIHNIDPQTTLFLNDYNTIEDNRDGVSSPAMYLQKIKEILQYPGNFRTVRLGIGLEGHFPNFPPNLPYMRSSIDFLGATHLPVWITEMDVENQNNQAYYFEQVLREAHAHPSVRGIVMWTAWSPQGCYRICLVDNNFRNLPAGDVVDKLLHEWGLRKFSAKTDQNGFFEANLSHGHYELEITHPLKNNVTLNKHIRVVPVDDESEKTTQIIKLSM